MENNQQSFWQFSDQLRLQTSSFANLSINDSIWSTSSGAKNERRNFDVRVGGEVNSSSGSKQTEPDFNGFNNGWKFGGGGIIGDGGAIGGSSFKNVNGVNGGFNKGIYSKPLSLNHNSKFNSINTKGGKNGLGKGEDDRVGGKVGKKNGYSNKNGGGDNNSNSNNNKNSSDKRFKTLPPSESLPRNETIGGYIFVCNNDTMQENLKRQLFGLPPRYRDSVRAITPGLPLFLYNYSTHQLHGVYEAASFGGTNIDPTAWEDKKCPGESRFPAQVRVLTRKICEPLEEDSFRPILHHYDGPKFRLELNIPEAISLLDIFEESNL
ncbi:B2 protein isoform X2 [Malania oleifera]|uniref:B2 protein isoform X2 n=1 Tax=Malania oleifera TaxID=397392 RepID=UPI0025AEB4B7|nr:B2 protein isoform X2 [Malania oleifera]